jgi:hypothetical protein
VNGQLTSNCIILSLQERHAEAAQYNFFPLTFVVPSEYRMFVEEFKRRWVGAGVRAPWWEVSLMVHTYGVQAQVLHRGVDGAAVGHSRRGSLDGLDQVGMQRGQRAGYCSRVVAAVPIQATNDPPFEMYG